MPPTQLKPICVRKLENSISVHGRAAVGIDAYCHSDRERGWGNDFVRGNTEQREAGLSHSQENKKQDQEGKHLQ